MAATTIARDAELIRIPRRFIQDSSDRGYIVPDVVRATSRHFWILRHDPAIADLIGDARFYSDRGAQDHDFGARALLRALASQGVDDAR